MRTFTPHTDAKAKTTSKPTPFFGPEQATPFFQTQLTVGQPGDKYEVEADSVANKVVNRQPGETPVLQRMSISSVGNLQRMPETEEGEEQVQRMTEDEEPIQRKPIFDNEPLEDRVGTSSAGEVDTGHLQAKSNKTGQPTSLNESFTSNLRQSKQNGQPLPKALRGRMNKAFNTDFSGVKIHTNSAAVQLSKAVNAKAFTHGRDIYFNEAQFAPESRQGEHLLAHELTHVLQQGKIDKQPLEQEEAPVQRKANEEGNTIQVRPEVLTAISLARSQEGKVNTKLKDDDGNRKGWERLKEYFDTAFGGKSPIAEVLIKQIIKQKKDGVNKDVLPSWCGIFVWWAFKKSGVPLPDWRVGKNILAGFDTRKPGELPQKGDIAYDDKPHQHYGFVTGVENASSAKNKPYKAIEVTTMNGNSAGDDNLGGQIQEQTHPISRWLEKKGGEGDQGGAFFKTFSGLDMPPAQLVEVAREAGKEEGQSGSSDTDTTNQPAAPTTSSDPIGDPYSVPSTTGEGATEPQQETDQEKAPEEGGEKVEEAVVATPQRPEDDPAFQQVKKGAGKAKKKQKNHGAPQAKSAAAQMASEIPADLDTDSKAQMRQVGVMGEQQKSPFDAETFKKKLLDRINAALPKDDRETVDEYENPHKSNKKLADAQGKMKEDVKSEKDKAAGPISTTAAAEPSKENITAKEVTPMSPEEVGQQPSVPNAQKAAPKPKTDQEISLEKEAGSLDEQMAENQISETQLANSNEPQFTGALQQKKEAQKVARATPGEYRKKEEPALSKSEQAARQNVLKGLTGMQGLRAEKLGQVDQDKNTTKSSDETKRKEIADKLKSIYQDTKKKVEDKLDSVETEVNKAFDTATSAAMATFKRNVKRRLDDHYGITVADDKIAEFITGELSPAIGRIFREEKETFTTNLNEAITKIANKVETGLTEAMNLIKTGKKNVDEFWNGLSPKLQELGQKAKDDIGGKFNDLEQSVTDRHDKLIEDLSNKYVAKVQSLQEEFDKLKTEAEGWVGAAFNAVGEVIKTIINLKNMLLQTLSRAAHVIGQIIDNPIGFLTNLVTAVKMGLNRFTGNILTHLKKGLIAWLLGNMPGGIEFPKKWDLKGIFSFVMQILGLTWSNIRARAVKKLGEPVVKALETAFEIFKIIATEGLTGLWKYIQKKVGDLKVMVMDAIKDFLKEKIIMAGIEWVIGLLNPAGAFIKACKMIYSIIMFFVERGQQIMALVNSVIDSVALIVAGNLDQAAGFVEKSLAKAIPVTIGFLASLLGLGGIAEKVQKIIDMVRKPINKAIDWVLDKAIAFAKKIGLVGLMKKGQAAFNKGKDKVVGAAKNAKDKLLGWLGVKKSFKAKDGSSHKVFLKKSGKGAKLMIASTVTTYSSFVGSFKIEADDTDKAKKEKAKTEAMSIADKIDTHISNPQIRRDNADAESAELQRKIQQLLNELAKHTMVFAFVKKGELPPSVINYGAINSEGGATYTDAVLLSSDHVKGSTPKDYPKIWKKANRRKTKSVFVRGHLLNHHIGGPGYAYNLTPITGNGAGFGSGYANRLHLDTVESKIKPLVQGGKVVRYKVKALYIKHPDRTFQQTLRKRIGTADEKQDDKLRLDIMNYEQNNLPVSINTDWAILKHENGKWVDDEVKTPILIRNQLPTTTEFEVKNGKE